MKGNLIIISSPSGGGKGTLIREILRSLADLKFSVSYTTRQKRDGEQDGREYHFVDRDEFQRLLESGEFLEHAEVHGNYYGTSINQVRKLMDAGTDVLLEIDVQGASILHDKVPDAISIFIMPPSFETLRTRLTMRATESSGDLQVRLTNSFNEIKEYTRFKYVVINDDLSKAVNELRTIICAERLRSIRQMDHIDDIIASFGASKLQFTGE